MGTGPPTGSPRTGPEAVKDEVEALAEAGHLAVHSSYKEWPLYSCRDIDAVDVELLAAVVAERLAWMAASLHTIDARNGLGWRREEFDRAVAERGITAGRYGRYARTDIEALAANEELVEQLLADRLLGPNQAAEHLEIRRSDFDYLIGGELIAQRRYTFVDVTRYRSVTARQQ